MELTQNNLQALLNPYNKRDFIYKASLTFIVILIFLIKFYRQEQLKLDFVQ